MSALKCYGALLALIFVSAYLVKYVFGIAGWNATGWSVTVACCGVSAVMFLTANGLLGRTALRWAVDELKSFGLFLAVCLGSLYVLQHVFDVADRDVPDWQFFAALGLGISVWMAIPSRLLERLRTLPKLPPLSATGKPRDLRKAVLQNFLLDRSIRQDTSER